MKKTKGINNDEVRQRTFTDEFILQTQTTKRQRIWDESYLGESWNESENHDQKSSTLTANTSLFSPINQMLTQKEKGASTRQNKKSKKFDHNSNNKIQSQPESFDSYVDRVFSDISYPSPDDINNSNSPIKPENHFISNHNQQEKSNERFPSQKNSQDPTPKLKLSSFCSICTDYDEDSFQVSGQAFCNDCVQSLLK